MGADNLTPPLGSATLSAYGRGLERRYPGVRVEIDWIARDSCPAVAEYEGWRIDFRAPGLDILIRHGLLSRDELGTADLTGRRQPIWLADEFGHTRGVYPCDPVDGDAARVSIHVPDFIPEVHWSERRVHTKKMQRQVAQLLKRVFRLPRRAAAQP